MHDRRKSPSPSRRCGVAALLLASSFLLGADGSCSFSDDEGCSADNECAEGRVCVDRECVDRVIEGEGEGELGGEGEGEEACASDDDCSRSIACSSDCTAQGECAFLTFPDATPAQLAQGGYDAHGCRVQGSDENICALCEDSCATDTGSCTSDTDCPSGFVCDGDPSRCSRAICTDDCQCGFGLHCDERTGSCAAGPACNALSCDVGTSSCDECSEDVAACSPIVVNAQTQFRCAPEGEAQLGEVCNGRGTRCAAGTFCLCGDGAFCDGTDGVCARYCATVGGTPACDVVETCVPLTDEVGFCDAS